MNKRMNLRRVRLMVKGGELADVECALILEAVLDMLADGLPGLLAACVVEWGQVACVDAAGGAPV